MIYHICEVNNLSFRRHLTVHPNPNLPCEVYVFLSMSYSKPGGLFPFLAVPPPSPTCPTPQLTHETCPDPCRECFYCSGHFCHSQPLLQTLDTLLLSLHLVPPLWFQTISNPQLEFSFPVSARFSKFTNLTTGSLGLMPLKFFVFLTFSFAQPSRLSDSLKVSCSSHRLLSWYTLQISGFTQPERWYTLLYPSLERFWQSTILQWQEIYSTWREFIIFKTSSFVESKSVFVLPFSITWPSSTFYPHRKILVPRLHPRYF